MMHQHFTTQEGICEALSRTKFQEGKITEAEMRVVAAAAKPGIFLRTRVVADDFKIAVGATKLGGRPDLPAKMGWPMRPAYPDGAKRAASHREDAEQPDKYWSWAKPEDIAGFRRDFRQMCETVDQPFPLHFVGQINFADLARTGTGAWTLPRTGLLSIFWDILEYPGGFDPAGHAGTLVLYHDESLDQFERRDTPADLIAMERYGLVRPMTCVPESFIAPVPPGSATWMELGLPQHALDAYSSWCNDLELMHPSEGGRDWRCHRVGGWPTPVQGPMQSLCAMVAAGIDCGSHAVFTALENQEIIQSGRDWVMIAQIGTDTKANLSWGDSGALYVWMHKTDLAARRFDKARIVVQSA
jgi:hypothetical protein